MNKVKTTHVENFLQMGLSVWQFNIIHECERQIEGQDVKQIRENLHAVWLIASNRSTSRTVRESELQWLAVVWSASWTNAQPLLESSGVAEGFLEKIFQSQEQ